VSSIICCSRIILRRERRTLYGPYNDNKETAHLTNEPLIRDGAMIKQSQLHKVIENENQQLGL